MKCMNMYNCSRAKEYFEKHYQNVSAGGSDATGPPGRSEREV